MIQHQKSRGGDCRFFLLGDCVRLVRHTRANAGRHDRRRLSCLGILPNSICREVIVIKNDMPMQSCILSQPAFADWKEGSFYRGDQRWMSRIKCVP
jgi:hypothetical protein